MSMSEHPLLSARRRLVSRHARLVGRLEAEDLASEAVARALEHPAPDGRTEPWLEVIFQRLLCDHFRRRARATRGASALAGAHDHEPTPETVLLEHERRRLLAEALAAVPPGMRAALTARFWREEASNPDAATPTATAPLPAVTLRTRLHRALARLRGSLGGLRGFIPFVISAAPPATRALAPALVVALAVGSSAPLAVTVRDATPPVRLAQARDAAGRPRPPAPAATPAEARATVPVAKPAAQPAARHSAAVKRFDFEDDEITADLHRPDDEILIGPPDRLRHASLIEIPSSFAPAVARMLEDL
jgi:RNA polymerase sigma factor (sigma-70 family)